MCKFIRRTKIYLIENILIPWLIYRGISIYLVTFFGLFTASLISNYVATLSQLETMLENSMNGSQKFEASGMLENQILMDTLEAWTYVCHFFNVSPSVTQLKIYFVFFFVSNLLAIGRLIASDVLFYSWYFIVLEQYRELSKYLKDTLRDEAPSTKLREWIEHHHHVNEWTNIPKIFNHILLKTY